MATLSGDRVVIPAAKVRYAFGGGGGYNKENETSMGGGGEGAVQGVPYGCSTSPQEVGPFSSPALRRIAFSRQPEHSSSSWRRIAGETACATVLEQQFAEQVGQALLPASTSATRC